MDAVTSGLNTEIFSAEREWTVEGLPVLTAQVSLPEPVGSENRTTRRIRRYYRAQCRAFLRYCDRWLFPMAARACREALADSRPLPQLQAELSFRVTYNEGGFWSLYTQIREQPPMDTFCCDAGAIPGTCGGAIRFRFRAFFRTGGAGSGAC